MAVFRLSSSKVQSEIKRLAKIAHARGWELSAGESCVGKPGDYVLYHVYSTASLCLSLSSGQRRRRRQKQQLVAVWKSLENGEFLASCSCSAKSATSVLCHHAALAAHDFFVSYAIVAVKTDKIARSSSRRDRECDRPPRPMFVFTI
jgi:hypothetical protein